MDIHQTGTPEDRKLAGLMLTDAGAWRTLENAHRFEWALLRRLHGAADVSLDIVEADSNWTLAFLDDAAALYLRRDGRFAALADSFGFRRVRAGRAGMAVMGRALADSVARHETRVELERMARSSAANSGAHSILSQLDMIDGDWKGARAHLEEAHRVDPQVPLYESRLGWIALREGDRAGADRAFREALRRDPTDAQALQGLGALSGNSH
jgi:tetratricopeptide (TPR) repeat protein